MSLHLEFEPHSWYKGFAIKRNHLHQECKFIYLGNDDGLEWYRCTIHDTDAIGNVFACNGVMETELEWSAYTDDGMRTYGIIDFHADTLKDLKRQINDYIMSGGTV